LFTFFLNLVYIFSLPPSRREEEIVPWEQGGFFLRELESLLAILAVQGEVGLKKTATFLGG